MIDLRHARKYYLHHARIWSGRHTLKLDAHNECYTDQPLPGGIAGNLEGLVEILEYDRNVIDRAHGVTPGLTITEGDIRSMPYADGVFDSLIDCSTIDHLLPEGMAHAVQEYGRVLQVAGRLMLISWCSSAEEECTRPWDHSAQYFCDLPLLRTAVAEQFHIMQEETFFRDGPRFLHRICGVRRCRGNT